VCGAEALVRWQHPTRGLVSPGEFIPLVEELGLISTLGAQVIDMAARQATLWQKQFGPRFRISFNISPLQFTQGDVMAEFDAALERTKSRADALEVEITESTLMSHPDQVIATLQAFRDRGVRVALDDFGTGFSSLSYLQRLPLDVLKIDRSFVNDIGSSYSGTALVDAMLFIARALNLDCVAEGVELESQLNFLATHRCNEAQGFWIAKPMPATVFEDWHKQWLLTQRDSKIA
jgi:EAL domain-containing protein (putative c-di-GMP-specific phosphodiesterase class I)